MSQQGAGQPSRLAHSPALAWIWRGGFLAAAILLATALYRLWRVAMEPWRHDGRMVYRSSWGEFLPWAAGAAVAVLVALAAVAYLRTRRLWTTGVALVALVAAALLLAAALSYVVDQRNLQLEKAPLFTLGGVH